VNPGLEATKSPLAIDGSQSDDDGQQPMMEPFLCVVAWAPISEKAAAGRPQGAGQGVAPRPIRRK